MGTGSSPGVKCSRGVLLALLVPRSWKSRAIPLPALWASPGLKRDHFTFTFYIYIYIYTYIYICVCVCVCVHITDCVEVVYELPLLPNKTNSSTCLYKPAAMRNVDQIFLIGVPAWRWLGEYVSLDKKFHSFIFKQEIVANPMKSSRADSRVKVWKFSKVSGTDRQLVKVLNFYGVSGTACGELSHLDVAVCLRRFYWILSPRKFLYLW